MDREDNTPVRCWQCGSESGEVDIYNTRKYFFCYSCFEITLMDEEAE